ncbi:MAG: biopolymer transporter ExbD [Planctomycetota bacterium]
MRSPTRTNSPIQRVNMTPMIDVVFLLIIFFLVSSHLARREIRYPVELAATATGERIDTGDAFITVTIDAQHQVRMSGVVVSVDQMQTRIRQKRDAIGRDAAVRLRIDRSVPFQFVRPVLTALTEAGIRRVGLASEAIR